MDCPHFILIRLPWLSVTLHTRGDVRWKYVTWAERLNPLRYEVRIGPRLPVKGTPSVRHLIVLNRDGLWRVKWANFNWKHLGGEDRYEKRCARAERNMT
jgi:hypothetical protein